ncbi:MAG: SH3 domain-containing protein [Bacteroidota bacterium]
MAKEKASGFVKAQFILFGVLLFVFFIWANRKCTRSQTQNEIEALEEQYQQMSDSLTQARQAEATPPATRPISPSNEATRRDTIRGGQMQIIRDRITPLYITIENLALRKGPGLNYEIVDRFKLYEEVSFLNEVSDSAYTIKLGQITTTEPWVKVRSRKGRDGWVYGAGVDYYKHKLQGVE